MGKHGTMAMMAIAATTAMVEDDSNERDDSSDEGQ